MNETSWHHVILRDVDLTLRPIEESDWAFIYRWRNDPEVLYYSDGPGIGGYDLDEIKNDSFQAGFTNRFGFMMVAEKQIIGECWLQRMNLTRLLERYPDQATVFPRC